MNRLSFVVLASILALSVFARAETIEFPEEELATESVLPVFDKTVVVRERAVKTAGRFEAGLGLGLNLVEPLYGEMEFNFNAAYHFDETRGINLIGMLLNTSLSSAGEDLKAGKGLNGKYFDATKAPAVKAMLLGNYQFTAYYGKYSMAKDKTMNLSLYGFAGGGLVEWTDKPTVGFDFGVGQKFYFSPNLALRFDMFMTLYSGPDPTSPKTTGHDISLVTSRSSSNFDSTFYFHPFLIGSLVWLF